MTDNTPTIEQKLLDSIAKIDRNLSLLPYPELRDSFNELKQIIHQFIRENTDDLK